MQPLLDKLYENCYTCLIVQKQPKPAIIDETKSNVLQPHRYFHADVIKRGGQNILIVIDLFTSMVSSTILQSEKTQDLRSGIINLTTPLRHPGPISMITDWAPGFISLAKDDK